MPTLQDAGFRFVYVSGEYKWLHPAEVPAGAIDCTDMDDAEFDAFVTSHGIGSTQA